MSLSSRSVTPETAETDACRDTCGPIQMPLKFQSYRRRAQFYTSPARKRRAVYVIFNSASGGTTPLPTGIVTQRRRDGGRHACVGECTTSCLPAARCIRATLFGKGDDLQFPPLRVHVLTRRISAVACLVCSRAQVEPLEATGS